MFASVDPTVFTVANMEKSIDGREKWFVYLWTGRRNSIRNDSSIKSLYEGML